MSNSKSAMAAIRLSMGTLHPALTRLEQRGFACGEWRGTETSRRARYYAITAADRRALPVKHAEWDQTAAIIHSSRHDLG